MYEVPVDVYRDAPIVKTKSNPSIPHSESRKKEAEDFFSLTLKSWEDNLFKSGYDPNDCKSNLNQNDLNNLCV